jgi:AcrR family transcriptional regulator
VSPAEVARTQKERRTEAERRLLEAAAEMIGEGGPAAVTLASVGKRAGYSRGLATHHFGSKSGLMQRVADAVAEDVRDAFGEGDRPASVMEELLLLVRTYIDIVSDPPPLNRARLVLMADAVASGSPDVRPAMVAADRAFRDSIARGIQRGVAAGEFAESVDPSGLASVVVGMLRGVTFQSMIDDHVDLDAARAEIEQLLTARLRPAPSRATKSTRSRRGAVS